MTGPKDMPVVFLCNTAHDRLATIGALGHVDTLKLSTIFTFRLTKKKNRQACLLGLKLLYGGWREQDLGVREQ